MVCRICLLKLEFETRYSNSIVRQLVRFRVSITMMELASRSLTTKPGWSLLTHLK